MKKLKYIMVVSKDGDGFMATFPEFPGCMTGAKTLEELRALADDAVRLFLFGYHKEGQEIPEGLGDGVIEILEIENDPADWHKVIKMSKPMEAV